MHTLFKKRQQAWAPKFILALEAHEHLLRLAKKIRERINKDVKSNTTDTVKNYDKNFVALLAKKVFVTV